MLEPPRSRPCPACCLVCRCEAVCVCGGGCCVLGWGAHEFVRMCLTWTGVHVLTWHHSGHWAPGHGHHSCTRCRTAQHWLLPALAVLCTKTCTPLRHAWHTSYTPCPRLCTQLSPPANPWQRHSGRTPAQQTVHQYFSTSPLHTPVHPSSAALTALARVQPPPPPPPPPQH